MSRYLVDVTVTLEVECDSPDDIGEAALQLLEEWDAPYIAMRVDDEFTVLPETL